MKIIKTAIGTLTVVILIGAAGAGALYWRLEPDESIVNPGGESTEGIWNVVSWRVRIYLQSARGGVPEFSMSEFWGLTRPGRGFLCTEDSSLQASIRYSSIAGFSLPMTYRTANSNGDLIRSRVLAKSGTKRGRTMHGDQVAGGPGSPGAMIRRPICSTGASAIQARHFSVTRALATTFSPTA
jgi:hypothetical protein